MADLTTPAQIESELVATVLFDQSGSLDLAWRRVGALRRKLDLAQSASRESDSFAFDQNMISKQLAEVMSWIRANTAQTAASRIAYPQVLHADFSQTGKYAGMGS